MPRPIARQLRWMSLLFIAATAAQADDFIRPPSDAWQWEIAPYLWAANMNGRVQVANQTGHVSQTFSDILSNLNWGGMLWLGAKKDKFGLFLNALYMDLSEDTKEGPVTVDTTTHFGVFSAGISYDAWQKTFDHASRDPSQVTLTPYLGARYTLNDTTLKVLSVSASENQHWTDPIVGARLTYAFNKRWEALFAGDVGGTNFNNDKSYSATALLGYAPASLRHTSFYLGYRILYQDYLTGSGINRFDWNMKLFGPLAGISFRF